MRRANGTGTIVRFCGNRKRPFAIRITEKYENGKQKYKFLSYHETREDAEMALLDYQNRGEIAEPKFHNHGEHHSRLNNVWSTMIQRCYNPSFPSYKYYGAKGVAVCEEWRHEFANFRDWAVKHGYDYNAPRGECTIDRIDPTGDYTPTNCRFVNMVVQNNNKRKRSAKYAINYSNIPTTSCSSCGSKCV